MVWKSLVEFERVLDSFYSRLHSISSGSLWTRWLVEIDWTDGVLLEWRGDLNNFCAICFCSDSLRFSSFVSVILAVVFVGISTVMAVMAIVEGKTKRTRLVPEVEDETSFFELFTAVPVIVTAFTFHFNGTLTLTHEVSSPYNEESFFFLCSFQKSFWQNTFSSFGFFFTIGF